MICAFHVSHIWTDYATNCPLGSVVLVGGSTERNGLNRIPLCMPGARGREGVVVQRFSALTYWRWRLGHTANQAYIVDILSGTWWTQYKVTGKLLNKHVNDNLYFKRMVISLCISLQWPFRQLGTLVMQSTFICRHRSCLRVWHLTSVCLLVACTACRQQMRDTKQSLETSHVAWGKAVIGPNVIITG